MAAINNANVFSFVRLYMFPSSLEISFVCQFINLFQSKVYFMTLINVNVILTDDIMSNGSILSIFSELCCSLITLSDGVCHHCLVPLTIVTSRPSVRCVATCLIVAPSLLCLIETSIVISYSKGWIILRQRWTSTLGRYRSTCQDAFVRAACDCTTCLGVVVGLARGSIGLSNAWVGCRCHCTNITPTIVLVRGVRCCSSLGHV